MLKDKYYKRTTPNSFCYCYTRNIYEKFDKQDVMAKFQYVPHLLLTFQKTRQ